MMHDEPFRARLTHVATRYVTATDQEAAAEKIREDRLRANGYEVVRLTWADLDNPRRVDALIRAALARAAARGRRPAS